MPMRTDSASTGRARRLARPRLVAALWIVATAVGCAGEAPTPGVPTLGDASSAQVPPSDVGQAIADLAAIGVAIHAGPGEPNPVVPVVGALSPLRFLAVEARSFALEARYGAGVASSRLDEVAVSAGGQPISGLIVRWMEMNETAAARYAADAWSSTAGSSITGLMPLRVIVAFLADATRTDNVEAEGPPGALLIGHSGRKLGRPALEAPIDDFCADLSAYLVDALNGLFALDPVIPPWLRNLVASNAPQYAEDPALFVRVIGALGLLVHVTALARPWWIQLLPEPIDTRYGVVGDDPVEGQVDLTALRDPTWADQIADCASLAALDVEPAALSGSLVIWGRDGFAPHANIVDAHVQLDEDGQAELDYVTATECREAASGTTITDQIIVGALVERVENELLAEAIEAILLGDAYGTALGAQARATYERTREQLFAASWPGGSTTIPVTHHHGGCPSPTPVPTASTVAADDCALIASEIEVERLVGQPMTYSPYGSGAVPGVAPGQHLCTYAFDASPPDWDTTVVINRYRDEALTTYHRWLDGHTRTNPVRPLAGIADAIWDPVSTSAWVIVGETGLSVQFWGSPDVLDVLDLETIAADLLRMVMGRV